VAESVRHAVVLAAGMGMRLRSIGDDRPKGLLEIGGETLVGRSTRLLRAAGIERVTIVAGHRADDYRRFAEGRREVDLLINDRFAETGSMASLAIGLRSTPGDVVVLESDIVYDERGPTAILAGGSADATLLSGPTGAGDEVWVSAPHGAVQAMSKTSADLAQIDGEFVGITRLSRTSAETLCRAFERFVAAHGHGRMDYETGGLIELSRTTRLAAVIVADLCWGEIDDERQLQRVVRDVWPRLNARSATSSETIPRENV